MSKEIKVPSAPAVAPGIGAADVFRYLPLLMEIIAAFTSGTGTFSTWTPRGTRYVRVQEKPFDAAP